MLLQERQSGSDEADVIDEEEFVLLKQERDAKRSYRCLVFNLFSFSSPSLLSLLFFLWDVFLCVAYQISN